MGTPKLHYINTLPEDKLAEVRRLIRLDGYSNPKIARTIQNDWGFHTDVATATLTKAIQRYSKFMERAALEHDLEQSGLLDRVAAVEDNIDVLEEMVRLCAIQKLRLMKVYARERDSPMLLGSVSAEAMRYHTMLKDMAAVQLETGLLKRAPKTTTGVLSSQVGDDDPNVIKFRITEETEEILKAIDVEFEHVHTDRSEKGQELLGSSS